VAEDPLAEAGVTTVEAEDPRADEATTAAGGTLVEGAVGTTAVAVETTVVAVAVTLAAGVVVNMVGAVVTTAVAVAATLADAGGETSAAVVEAVVAVDEEVFSLFRPLLCKQCSLAKS
jgi:hypothetical protein